MKNILEAKGICKKFGAVQALSKVDIYLEKNEILALVGDNGAGKSTLMKILAGAIKKDEGERKYGVEIYNEMNINIKMDVETIKEVKNLTPDQLKNVKEVMKSFGYSQVIGNTDIQVDADVDKKDTSDLKTDKRTDVSPDIEVKLPGSI